MVNAMTKETFRLNSSAASLYEDQKVTVRALRKWQEEGVKNITLGDADLVGRYSALDMVNVETGEIYVEAGDELTEENIEQLRDAGFEEIVAINVDHVNIGAYIRNTMAVDKNHNRDHPYRHLAP